MIIAVDCREYANVIDRSDLSQTARIFPGNKAAKILNDFRRLENK